MQISTPTGTENPLQLGSLSLGPVAYHDIPGNYTGPPLVAPAQPPNYKGIYVNTSLIPNAVAAQGNISSASYGLHIGSAILGPSLSLWIGGYDQSRVIGNVSVQSITSNLTLEIDLLDIGIGVESGPSPFDVPLQQGLLTSGNESLGNFVSVTMDPLRPYLYLPASTCSAIAQTLPVTYNGAHDLFTWDINDVRYTRIVSSPSYLGFIFRSGSGTNLTVNVPFALLNLKLDATFVASPIPYFPCQPPSVEQPEYSLGRAFLQAAFVGVNWDVGPGQWYLSQAPGPNTPSQPSQANFSGPPTAASNVTWADTWKGYSKPSSATATSMPTKPVISTGLSGGAKAGIVVGVLGGFAAIATASVLLLKRRRDKLGKPALDAKEALNYSYLGSNSTPATELSSNYTVKDVGGEKVNKAPDNQPKKLDSSDHEGIYELPGYSDR